MNITRLIAIDESPYHSGSRILFERVYTGISEDVVFEFLNDMNDDLSLEMNKKEISDYFMKLISNGNCTLFNKIYVDRKILEI